MEFILSIKKYQISHSFFVEGQLAVLGASQSCYTIILFLELLSHIINVSYKSHCSQSFSIIMLMRQFFFNFEKVTY